MFIGIGGKKEPTDVVDLLLDCHTRIRSFSTLAARLAEVEGASDEEVAQSAAKVRRYFTMALPKHVEDEEESLLPRLMGKDPEVDRALQQMEDEHGSHEAPLRRLLELCDTLQRTPSSLPSLRGELGEVARWLVAEFEVHLQAEETIVLPAARRLLAPEELQAIHDELRRRRADVT
jgi:iron-sulfur cluster repair protein YtfE (RIC family)